MRNQINLTAEELKLEDREHQLRRFELDLDFKDHELEVERSKVELEKQKLSIYQDKAKLEKDESKLKEQIKKLERFEMEFYFNGSDIIKLAISKSFRRGMVSMKERELYRDANALQRYRYEQYVYVQDLDEKDDRLAEFLDTETRLREIAQQVARLKDQFLQDSTRIEELIEARKEYTQTEFVWSMIRNSFSGYLERAFEYWRGNPRWYMHRVLREDCAGRGGCCGRGCGCCVDRKLDLTHTRGAGHCTVECGCCQEARGYELSEDEKKAFSIRYAVCRDGCPPKIVNDEEQHEASTEDNVMRYEFSQGGVFEYERYRSQANIADDEAEFTDYDSTEEDEEDPYYRRISQASIWGLIDGNFEDPFDLIDEEPFVGKESDSTMTERDW
ncbi:hypothetical protein N7445_004703 [Penicillium cf. griseofulvum]|nr:hypothetical protein N7445_004703 [Penicillium cf. griseofulvum]